MAQITVHEPDVPLSEPTLIEGLPGVGLVGKITPITSCRLSR